MAKIKCGACKGAHETVDLVRACYGLPDKANTVMSDPNKPLIVTCGWGNNAHSWETTKSEAAANGGKCPKCRGEKKA